MESHKAYLASPFSSLFIFFLTITSFCGVKGSSEEQHRVKVHDGPVVEKDQRKTLLANDYGEIYATSVKDGHGSSSAPPYHLQFFTLEPNSVFLPVLLHAAMVFYVYTGSGKLTWTNGDDTSTIDLREGDVCSLEEGSVFYIHSNLEAERKKLRINAMFANRDDSTYDPSIGAYSRINKLVKGFDKKIVQAAFKVPDDLAEAITNKTDTPAIVHAATPEKKHKNPVWELEALYLKYFQGITSNSKKHKTTYNIFENDPDFKNPHGWTSTVTKKQLKQLKRHNTGFLLVNLTMGSMLGPHWNPRATEIAVVLQGEGMVRVVCGSNNDDKRECQNMRFRVKQGDVFVVPRFHPVAHMSFSKEPLAFMGFSTAAKENHPQFLTGKGSVLQILDKQIVATSFGVGETTIDGLLASRDDAIIFGCSSCAEEEEEKMKEDEERKKEEEEGEGEGKGEEARRKKEEEEEARRKEEERKREEEEARRQQEERERRREEEAEEEAGREQEEARKEREREKEGEEAARRQQKQKREEEAARRQQEKRERKKQEEEKEARTEREKERRREEREREAARREKREEAEGEEEEAARRQREKREKRREEERARREEEAEREQEEREREAARREKREEAEREEEAAAARRQQEKREKRREEERARREEEAEKEQEHGRREEEEAAEGEEEAARRQQEERETRREEDEARTERERGGERRRRRGREEEEGGGESVAEWEEEEARREQEERERRRERDSYKKGSRFEGTRVLKIRNV